MQNSNQAANNNNINTHPFDEEFLPACTAEGLYPSMPYYSKLSRRQWLLLQNLMEESLKSENLVKPIFRKKRYI
jgi:hypothetical protein